jgi:hypothetical protein
MFGIRPNEFISIIYLISIGNSGLETDLYCFFQALSLLTENRSKEMTINDVEMSFENIYIVQVNRTDSTNFSMWDSI